MEDIRETGTRGLKGLPGLNRQSSSIDDFINARKQAFVSGQVTPESVSEQYNAPAIENIGLDLMNKGYGQSIYDTDNVNESTLSDLNEYRAESQPWYAQIGAGLAKGALLAGTTFLDGTIGLVIGAGTAIGEGRWSGLWDNEFSRTMQSITDWSEQVMPNYYSQEERENPWYENIFTANFLGDKFIKNLGFSVGAIYSGGVYAAPFKMTKVASAINGIMKSTNATANVASVVGSTISAVNEGRIEALNNSRDWFNFQKAQLDDWYSNRIGEEYSPLFDQATAEYEATKGKFVQGSDGRMYDPAYLKYQQTIATLQDEVNKKIASKDSDSLYQKTLGKITEDRLKMGNVDLLINIPVLAGSNWIQFSKFYAGGMRNASRAANITGRAERIGQLSPYTAGTTKAGTAWAITKGALSEGTEEISQKAASTVSGNYYGTDVSNFYKARTDREAEQETLNWIKAVADGVNETVNDGSSWEEFFIGALTGVLGVPTFRSPRAADGSFQSPIELQGGAFNHYREHQEKVNREQEIINYMNSRVQSPEFLNYYQGLIRHNKYQRDMDQAVKDNDPFEFKNAEHAQMVSDIVMFDRAGKLEDLKSLIESVYDTSDANLESIITNTTAIAENGKLVGPFADYASTDDNGNIVANFGTRESKKAVVDRLTKSKDEMLRTINSYEESLNGIDNRFGAALNDSQLEELAWMKTQLTNWADRATEMSGEVKQAIGKVIGNLDSFIRFQGAIRTEEGMRHANLTDRYNRADKNIRDAERAVATLNVIRNLDDASLAANLARNPDFVRGLMKEITLLDDTVIEADEREDVLGKLEDIVKLGNASAVYNERFNEYLSNPGQQVSDHERADQEAAQSAQEETNASLRQKLDQATSVAQFRQILNSEQDVTTRDSVLQVMDSEDNQIAKNYRETLQYNNELSKALNELGEIDQVSQDAMTLWQEQFNSAENLEQLANPNSIYINNEDAFLEDSEGDVDMAGNRFQSARYALQRAMSKVNNNIRFKNRFSEEYRKPIDEPVSNKGTNKDETGDSGTSTVPHVNPNATPIETPSIPVGNITAEMIAAENSDANRRVETQRNLDQNQQGQRRYYRPAVPELHIEASKEGDFRPFDVVVAEREPGVDFSGIYSYLRDNGAFNYVNAAKIKTGDTLGFMIDPDFNDHTIFLVDTRNNQIVGSIDESDASVARYEGLVELIKKVRDEYQASRQSDTVGGSPVALSYLLENGVGTIENAGYFLHGVAAAFPAVTNRIEGIRNSLDKEALGMKPDAFASSNNPSISQIEDLIREYYGEDGVTIYKGLLGNATGFVHAEGAKVGARLEKLVPIKEASATRSTGRFFATPQTRVSKMMVGRVPYGAENRSLADIPGVLNGSAKPVFGIIKNGTLTTNEKIDDRLIIKPVDMSQKEGRLYLLIPNAAGTYSPAAVRVKHFNNQEFNIDDATVANTPIGRGINEALDRLADATSQDDVSIAMKELAQDIYMQDVMVTWFDAKAGSGIVISRKVRKPDGTYEMININGQEQVKENKYTIYYQSSKKAVTINGLEYTYEAAQEAGADMSLFGQPRDAADIRRDILNTIISFNLPIQVSVSKINDSGYNNRVIKSNVLTSNLREAKVIGSWFTTDYFDKQGNLQKSVSPSSIQPAPGRRTTTPVGGTEGVTQGTPVRVGNSTYTVDLKTMIYTDSKGAKYAVTTSNAHIFDMAWAQENFGDSTESSVMTENKVITPQGRVLDRNTGTYVSDAEAKRIKDKIAGRNQATQNRIAESKRVIADIYENQKRVDKTRTDSDYYYILEDDGQHHEYSRVHSRLGDNWLGERTETENSRRALEAGTAVDKVIRDFFTSKETPVKPDTLSEAAFIDLISKLTEIKSKMEQMGETFMADNIVLFQKYADGTRVAGEVDILSVDKNGNFKIYDVKTSKYSFSHRYFTEKSSMQRMSTKDYYTLQLSAYQNLFESQYGVRPTRLAILPFVLTYDKDRVGSITQEKGIPITYNPAVNVPLASAVQAPQPKSTLPIFDSTIETMIIDSETQNRVLPENAFEEGGEIGYYEKEGELYTGYLKKIGEVEVTYGSGQKEMVPIHVTKKRDRGFGKPGELGSTSEYIVVFPNGYAMTVVKRSASDNEAFKLIMDALSANPEKVLHLSNEKTQVYNPRMMEELNAEIRNAQYSQPQAPQPSGASEAVQKSDAINPHDEEFEDDLDLGDLRRVDDISGKIWNQEKELAWIKRVFPQLFEQDRVRVVKGLIQVAENGPVAWGMFSNGIITLSDVAADGTAYHEAFHAVFNLMLNDSEKLSLFNEARQVFGDKSLLELEEDMAEGFREYVSSQEDRSLGRKILDFFKNLFAKVTNWKYIKPSLTSYYRMINQGRYKSYTLAQSPVSRLREEQYTSEMQSIRDRAIADGTFMKAPNGSPTNLNERQWLQVRTESFKNWFGDWINNPSEASKVVDENGEPLVVYRWDNADFSIFDKEKQGSKYKPFYGKGFYFTSSKYFANWFGKKHLAKAYFLNSRDMEEVDWDTSYKDTYMKGDDTVYGDRHIKNIKYNLPRLRGKILDEFVISNPNQIKSATSNIGAFSATNNDIRYRALSTETLGRLLDEEYSKAKRKVAELNNKRYNTKQEAENAFNKSGINQDLFFRITRSGANNASGHKIQLLTKDQFKSYKERMLEEQEIYNESTIENRYFDSLDPDIQMRLFDKGWTQEKFDSISQAERDQAVECLGL